MGVAPRLPVPSPLSLEVEIGRGSAFERRAGVLAAIRTREVAGPGHVGAAGRGVRFL